MTTDKARINRAFKGLRHRGFFADGPIEDCQTCAWAVVGDDTNAVFYHGQEMDRAFEGDTLVAPLHLNHRGMSFPDLMPFLREGFGVRWDGSPHNTVQILPAWPNLWRAGEPKPHE